MRAQENRAQRAGDQKKARRSAVPSTPAQQMLALQRRAGNSALTRAIEEERHEHAAGCGHDQKAPAVQSSSVLDVLRTPGSPVAPAIRAKAEQGMGTYFGDVVLHTGPAARRSAAELGARAYTSGRHIVVGEGGNDEHTLLHELAHAWQQQKGAVEGTDNGGGLSVSDKNDKHEREAESLAHQIRRTAGPTQAAARPTAPQAAVPAQRADRIPVSRMMAGGGRTMHRHDRGQMFELSYRGRPVIGRYVTRAPHGGEVFDTESHGRITVGSEQIRGPRARVGGLHPPGAIRPPEENLRDRSEVFLSEADASAARARVRRDPGLADRMAITTFEDEPNYEAYPRNREDLRRLGVPVLNNVDLSRPEAADRFREVGPNANLHFQMPRVPRGTPGYSTQALVRDTARVPGRIDRDDVTVSVTTPHPSGYARPGTHNRFYGMESRRAVPPGMEITEAHSDSEGSLEEYGYNHRQSTKDTDAEVAKRRKKYRMRAQRDSDERRSDSPEEGTQSSYRSRSHVRLPSQGPSMTRRPTIRRPAASSSYQDDAQEERRRAPSQGPSMTRRPTIRRPAASSSYQDDAQEERRRAPSRAPSMTPRPTIRRPAASSSYQDDAYEERGRSSVRDEPTGMSRSRSRRGMSRGPAPFGTPDVSGQFSYGGGDPAEERRERSRSRSRRRAPSQVRAGGATRGRAVDVSGQFSYGGGAYDEERPVPRHRSRAAERIRERSVSRHRPAPPNYSAVDSEDDYPVSSQAARSEYQHSSGGGRRPGRRRRFIVDSDSE
ncbi:hypothetical protein QF035_005680 [Streptomyces umbrinus]|uniref:eCIS core domain-containing protein n=1 Tax=Streptomyces umbrinus TaxID=67370 RepID=A0ABU0SX22_9ACTN|nr:DUF4157 domain-containing protein [Streptomyces umbrinus]MDQ1028098.1 hypothetical protein [Streptomyces umbrinus]